MKRHLYFTVLGALLCLTGHSQTVEKGFINVKFKPQVEKLLPPAGQPLRAAAGSSLQMGRTELDKVMKQTGAVGMRQYFQIGGKFEARQRASHLHLWYVVEIDPKLDPQVVAKEFAVLPDVEIAEPRYKKIRYGYTPPITSAGDSLTGTPPAPHPAALWNDPYFSQQWGFHQSSDVDINLPEAWEICSGSNDVIVAIVDGGISYNHEDIATNMWSGTGYNFVNNNTTITADSHGTHVAGTVAAVNNNGKGVCGVAGGNGSGNGVRLMSCQIFVGDNVGDAGAALQYAADNGAVIAQNSWGYDYADVFDAADLEGIHYFIEHAGKDANGNPLPGTRLKGGIVIFAAGNEYGTSAMYYPGAFPEVVGVAAIASNGTRSSFSNMGAWVDICAPGSNIYSTYTSPTYNSISGTSMACPHVTGVAALIVSKFGHENYTPDSVRMRLLEGARPLVNDPTNAWRMGTGLLDAYGALKPYTRSTGVILSEDFEQGGTDWTIANGSQTNKWYIGTAGSGSNNFAYISNSSGNNNSYTTTSTSRVHFYKTVTLPPATDFSAENVVPYVEFDWKVNGEANGKFYDYIQVALTETSASVPAAGSTLSGSPAILGRMALQNTWAHAMLPIPITYMGTSKRLIFSWINDNSAGGDPAGAIDNVKIVYAYPSTGAVEPPLPSSDASLKSLTSSTPNLTPAFSPTEYNYYDTVPYSTLTANIQATANSSVATLNGTGQKQLNVGDNSYVITVTAEDQTTTQIYTVNIYRRSNDATLKSLSVQEGALSPQFSPENRQYTVNVPYEITAINISASVNHPSATLSGTGNFAINTGENVLYVNVTAEDSNYSLQYRLIINRMPSTDASLQSLTVSVGEISPNFTPSVTAYYDTVPYNTAAISITATAAHSDAQITGLGEKTLEVGDNIFAVTVTAQDQSTTKTYTLNIRRRSNDSQLKSLQTSCGSLVPDNFNPAVTAYSLNIRNESDKVVFIATPNHPSATVTGANVSHTIDALASGQLVELTVVAEDPTFTTTYSITVYRALSDDVSLKNILLSAGTLVPDFSPLQTEYRVEVENEIEQISIEVIPTQPTALVTGNGLYDLEEGEQWLPIRVHSDNYTTSAMYQICVNRLPFLGISKNAAPALSAYPIPAYDMLYVSSQAPLKKVVICSLQGEKLLELDGAQLAFPISLQNLSAGVYLLSATTATGETAEMKILKKTK